MHKKISHSKLLLIGSALVVASTSCSTIKFISNKFDKNIIDTNIIPTQNLEQRLRVPSKLNMDSTIIADLAAYRPKILEMPPDIRRIGGDSIDLSYERPESIDFSMIEHNLIVRDSAINIYPEKKFPGFKSYLGMIFKACDDYRTTFRVPSETYISLFFEESKFNPYIISTAPAFGIAQFMRKTAEWLGMHVYSQTKYPKLYKYETELEAVCEQYSIAETAASWNFHSNNFEIAKMYELKADSLYEVRKAVLAGFEKALRAVDITKLDDDRLVPRIAIPKAVWYFTSLARQIQRIYHCSDEQAINWAIDAYNAGLGSIKYVKPATETSIYNRLIHKDEPKLFPYAPHKSEMPYVPSVFKGIPSSKPPRDFLQPKK